MSESSITPSGAVASARRCLFGVTILLIEDSRAASEALRLFAIESGARLRRADSLASAHRHLAIYRPQVVIVDLGLPDGNGLELIGALAAAPAPFSAIVAMSGMDAGGWEAAALDAGASACLPKPIASLRAFQQCLLALLPARGVGAAATDDLPSDREAAVLAAYEADLRRAADLLDAALEAGDGETVAYVAQFVRSLNRPETDGALAAAARLAEEEGTSAGGALLLAALRRELGPEAVRGAA